jgi:hypothetical protein
MNLWTPLTVVLVGVVITALGVVWAGVQQHRTDTDGLKREAGLQKELAVRSDELARKSDQIAALNKELLNAMSGGEGYPKLLVLGGAGGRIVFFLMNSGGHALTDVTANVLYISDAEAALKSNPTFDFFEARALEAQSTRKIDVGTLLPSAPFALLPDFKLPDDIDTYSIEITTSSRNGLVKNLILFRKPTGGEWQWGFVTLGPKQERLQVVDRDNLLPDSWKNPPETVFKLN